MNISKDQQTVKNSDERSQITQSFILRSDQISIHKAFEPFELFAELPEINEELFSSQYRMLFESSTTNTQKSLKSILITQSALRISAYKNKVEVKALTSLGKELLKYLINYFSSYLLKARKEDKSHFIHATFLFKQDRFPRGVLTILEPLLALKRIDTAPFIGGLLGYDLIGEFYNVTIPEKGREEDLTLYFAEEMILFDHHQNRAVYTYFYDAKKKERAQREISRRYGYIKEAIHTLSSTLSSELSTDQSQKTYFNRGTTSIDATNLHNDKGSQEKIFNHQELFSQICPQDYSQIKSLKSREDNPIRLGDNLYFEDRESFKIEVQRYRERIKKGDFEQIVLSRSFYLPCKNPMASYRELKKEHPSPYLFYLEDESFTLFGASPESALKYTPERNELELYPIAGTMPRGREGGKIDLKLDRLLEQKLRTDKKEVAEHLMLVELAKKDLTSISIPNSVKVKELMKVDRYNFVMHLVSRVVGQLRTDLTPLDAYLNVMNMGTLTGSPKIAAMREIYRVETQSRGSYGGAIGYFEGVFGSQDRLDSAIVIRSAFVKKGVARVQAGAGIVADSDPKRELLETENKASSVISAILKSEKV